MFRKILALYPWPLPTASNEDSRAVKDLSLYYSLLKGVSQWRLGWGCGNKLNLGSSNVDNIDSIYLLLSAWNIYVLYYSPGRCNCQVPAWAQKQNRTECLVKQATGRLLSSYVISEVT